MAQPFHIETPRLRLRGWRDTDREAFAAMNADAEVMHDLGGPLSRSESDAKVARYAAVFDEFGFGRWLVENLDGEYLGYCGVMPVGSEHPLGTHHEIGWRLIRKAWGNGYATEAASAALADAFGRVRLKEIVAYTSPDNVRSQAVMSKLNLRRDASRDFAAHSDRMGSWRGLVWVAQQT